jgi:ATP-binding cassette subfamily A (ABC1) protein 3
MWFSQYKLVVGKNLKLKRRSKCGTCVECFFPIIVIIILIGFMQALLPSASSRFQRTLPPATVWMQDTNVLLYTPNDTTTNIIMNTFSLIHLQVPLNETASIKGFSTPAEMQQHYLDNYEETWAGVEFSSSEDTVAYAIRIDFYDVPDTEKRTDNDGGLSGNKDYMSTGFISLQYGLDSALLAITGAQENINTTTVFTPTVSEFNFEKPELWERYLSNLSGVYEILGPIFIVIALFVSNFRYLASIVAEKEAKIREEMRMMGLLPGVDNWAWFTTVMIVAIIPTFIISLVLSAQFYHNSSAATILFVIFSQLFSLYSLAILVSLFVSKAKFAGVIGFVIAIAMAIIGVVVVETGTGEGVKLFLALLSPAALVFANRGIIASEKAMVGTKTSNLGDKWVDDTPSVGAMIAFMYLDTLLYAFLAWYIDNVFPGEFGIARPPWFFVTKRYWSDLLGLRDTPHEGLLANQERNDDVEPVSDDMKDRAAVVIKRLKKTFTKGFKKFHAVDGLDMIMYDGQITAFLGHNGAGKTTTISMLTGLIPLSGGDAFVRGYSIRNQMRQVRKTLGICPQHDVIWPELSVYDHLFLYAGLKGVPYRQIKKAVNELIAEIGLEEKRNFPSGALSGGQKRKLCLAMAFVGGSDVIFLDEPTSGMDPVTRRGVWDFLNNNKKGKTIVLTTHFMDEADFLGDRVAIISHGSLRCAGSSLFLKSRLGVGYLLTMTKNKTCDSTKVDQLVLNTIHGSNILAAFGGELSYRLPKEAAPRFPEFFTYLDDNKEALGIDSYGVSLTTLEEVFLRIGMEEKIERGDDEEEEAGGANNGKELTSLGKDQDKINVALAHETQGHRFTQQLRAQLVKRSIMYRRDVRGMLFTFFLPFLFLVLSSAVIRSTDTIDIETEPPAPLNISTALYDRPYFVTGDPAWISTNPLYDTTTFIQRNLSGFDDYIRKDWEGRASGAYHLEDLGNDFTSLQPVTAYGIEFNKTFLHIIPAEIAFVSNALMRRFSNNLRNIQVINKPFPHVLSALEEAASSINPDLMYWSLIMLATFCLIPAGFVASIVQERVLNVKRLLSVSGASRSSYWASNFIFDWLMFLVLVLVAIIVVAAAGGKNFESDTIGAVFLLMFLFSLFITAQSYVLSLLFNSYSVVTGALFAFHFIMALAFNIGYNIVTFRAIDGRVSTGSLDTISLFSMLSVLNSDLFPHYKPSEDSLACTEKKTRGTLSIL